MLEDTTQQLKKLSLREGPQVEFKLAKGKDGQGAIPRSLYETYSAFANTQGGSIFLGVEEKGSKMVSIPGVKNPERICKELFDTLNSKEKASINLISSENIILHKLGTTKSPKTVIEIKVPKASYKLKPVYLNSNPKYSFRRDDQGDYICSELQIQHMIRDQDLLSDDDEIVFDYNLEDLLDSSIKEYQRLHRIAKPESRINQVDDIEFLTQIGAWKLDRKTKKEGPSKAGLLMFGKYNSIQSILPRFFLDYQEKPDKSVGSKYLDRISTEPGSLNNCFEFFHTVIKKLSISLKTGYRYAEDGITRIDESPLLEAYREALVNALIHADYNLMSPVKVLSLPDQTIFRNPGSILLDQSLWFSGGESLCRNPKLQQLFRLIGLSEQRGQGLFLIKKIWEQENNGEINLEEYAHRQADIYTELTLLFPDRIPDLPKQEARFESKDMNDLLKQVNSSSRANSEDIKTLILALAKNKYLRSNEIAEVIDRDITLIKDYINELVNEGKLEKKFDNPRHPKQAYRSIS